MSLPSTSDILSPSILESIGKTHGGIFTVFRDENRGAVEIRFKTEVAGQLFTCCAEISDFDMMKIPTLEKRQDRVARTIETLVAKADHQRKLWELKMPTRPGAFRKIAIRYDEETGEEYEEIHEFDGSDQDPLVIARRNIPGSLSPPERTVTVPPFEPPPPPAAPENPLYGTW